MNPDFWNGRRVLVTGHTGFKGAWLCLFLSRLRANVFGLALPPDSPRDLYNLARVAARTHSWFGDVRNSRDVDHAFTEADPEVVFHLAAQSLVLPSYELPVDTYSVNVIGTAHVLERCRSARNLQSIVVITSDKVYENREWSWGYREDDPLGGSDPYSSSKACAELVARAYRDSFFRASRQRCKIATARAGNVIGGGDWAANRIIPDFMRAIMANESLPVRRPHSIRPWQHVLEPLEGYLRLAEVLALGDGTHEGAWNFGPNSDSMKVVSELVADFASAWGYGVQWHHEEVQQPHEASLLLLDVNKTRRGIGWQPRWGYERSVRETADWYKTFVRRLDVEGFTCNQIESFLGNERSSLMPTADVGEQYVVKAKACAPLVRESAQGHKVHGADY